MPKTSGREAAFTYDFGIAIAQSTVTKLTRLTGATLTLASAYYALRTTSKEYIDTLRENTLRFGGVLQTMKAIEQARERLVSGKSFFDVRDQMEGMNKLMAMGVNVKNNLGWVSKAAHATGQSMAQFSGAVASAINGNFQSLVDMGVMTQRATRRFEKFKGNTIQMQGAVMSMLKSNKALQNAIINDFDTIEDHMRRVTGAWRGFILSIVGKPNDPGSLYGTTVKLVKGVADAISKNYKAAKKYGEGVGVVLTYMVKQVGKVTMWLGSIVKKTIKMMLGTSDNFGERMRSLVVWMEFWKVHIGGIIKEHSGAIKSITKVLFGLFVAKKALSIGKDVLLSVIKYKAAWAGLSQFVNVARFGMAAGLARLAAFNLMKRSTTRQILRFFGFSSSYAIEGAFTKVGESAAGAFSAAFSVIKNSGKFFINMFLHPIQSLKFMVGILRNLPSIIMTIGKVALNGIRMINLSNPLGWIIIGIELILVLYNKWGAFASYVNKGIMVISKGIRAVWNYVMLVYAAIRFAIQWVWGKIKSFFNFLMKIHNTVWNFISTKLGWFSDFVVGVGKVIDKWIISPIKWILNNIGKAFDKLGDWFGTGAEKIASAGGFKVATMGKEDASNLATSATNGMKTLSNFATGNFSSKEDKTGSALTSMDTMVALSTPISEVKPQKVTNDNKMVFNTGAIQIIVQKGENINEQELAEKIKRVILDIKRNNSMRGGDA